MTVVNMTAGQTNQSGSTAQIGAAIWKRIVAFIIDQILLYITFFTLGVVASIVLMYGFNLSQSESMAMLYPVVLFELIVRFLYGPVMESSTKQATFGKMSMGLKVTTADGQRLSFGRALVRQISKIFTIITLGFGFLMGACRQDKQALHDLVSETKVVSNEEVRLPGYGCSYNQPTFNQPMQPMLSMPQSQGSPNFSSNTIATAPPVMR